MSAVRRKPASIFQQLPECYRKFFIEWKHGTPAPVHYIPVEGKWKRNPETGEVTPVQNRPIQLTYPKEFDFGLWGGEAVVRGFQKRHQLRRRVPHFWFPTLQKHVFHSDILDRYMEITCTRRTLELVDKHYGFDNYILETPPQDLKSLLGIKLKREMLLALAKKDFLPNNPTKREELLEKYKKYILPLDEAEWYGLTLKEALDKFNSSKCDEVQEAKVPLKVKFRMEFIEQLKEKEQKKDEALLPPDSAKSSWISQLNPFRSNKSV